MNLITSKSYCMVENRRKRKRRGCVQTSSSKLTVPLSSLFFFISKLSVLFYLLSNTTEYKTVGSRMFSWCCLSLCREIGNGNVYYQSWIKEVCDKMPCQRDV